MTAIADALRGIRGQIEAACVRCGRAPGAAPRLVAVSKTKPKEAVAEAYAAGQRHFGENYVQELLDKAPALPGDIAWHFIGKLQSNKAKALVAGVPNLWVVESVDSAKLASKLDAAAAAAARASPLRVFLQVNTSGEPQKGGVEDAAAAVELARHVATACPRLALAGLMTVGKVDEVATVFFERLVAARAAVASALGVDPATLELSMGMSGDLELAVAAGSTNVRVGSAIFGARVYPPVGGGGAGAAPRAADAAAPAAAGDTQSPEAPAAAGATHS